MSSKHPLVCHRNETRTSDWPYGKMQRIVTGGVGGVANVHVARTKSLPCFVHAGYDEVYYIVSGTGAILLNGTPSRIHAGSVAVIPAGISHALEADPGQEFEFVIFGLPPMSIEDERAKPQKV